MRFIAGITAVRNVWHNLIRAMDAGFGVLSGMAKSAGGEYNLEM